MLFQSLRALCFAPGGPGSIWKHLGAAVMSTEVCVWFACGFRTNLHFADERHVTSGVFIVERDQSWCWAGAVRCGYKLMILERLIDTQHHQKKVPDMPGVAKTPHARCPIILLMNKSYTLSNTETSRRV